MKITCPKCGASGEVDMGKIPPGVVLLRCDNCGNSFHINISSKDIAHCESELDARGRWFVTCPHCGGKFQVDETKAKPDSIWLCPNCNRVMFLSAPPRTPENNLERKDFKDFSILASEIVQSETLEQLVENVVSEQERSRTPGSSFIGVGKESVVIPPLSEKERYTAQFMVRVGNNEMGPVSFNVLEDWARSGIIGKDAMISKAGESNYFLAIQMPELSAIFLGEGKTIEEILSEEKSIATVLTEGAISGALGGIIAGVVFSFLVIGGIARPMAENPIALQIFVSLGIMAFLGSVLGIVISLCSLWVVEYPWTAQFSLIPSFFLSALIMVYLLIKGAEFMHASFITGMVFTIIFIAAYVGCLFHRTLYEKY